MFDSPYPHIFVTKRKGAYGEPFLFEYIYRFRGRFNHTYLIRVEEYQHNVFAIKFHLKAHSSSENKYNLTTKFYDAPRVLSTTIGVMVELFKQNAV